MFVLTMGLNYDVTSNQKLQRKKEKEEKINRQRNKKLSKIVKLSYFA